MYTFLLFVAQLISCRQSRCNMSNPLNKCGAGVLKHYFSKVEMSEVQHYENVIQSHVVRYEHNNLTPHVLMLSGNS